MNIQTYFFTQLADMYRSPFPHPLPKDINIIKKYLQPFSSLFDDQYDSFCMGIFETLSSYQKIRTQRVASKVSYRSNPHYNHHLLNIKNGIGLGITLPPQEEQSLPLFDLLEQITEGRSVSAVELHDQDVTVERLIQYYPSFNTIRFNQDFYNELTAAEAVAAESSVDEIKAFIDQAVEEGDRSTKEEAERILPSIKRCVELLSSAKQLYTEDWSPAVTGRFEGAPIEEVLDNRIDNAELSGADALVVAANGDHTDAAQLLLDQNITVDNSELSGADALVVAASGDHTDAAQLLLDQNITVDNSELSGAEGLVVAKPRGHNTTYSKLDEYSTPDSAPSTCPNWQTVGLFAVGIAICAAVLAQNSQENINYKAEL
jgi:hypothetical protein